MEIDQQTAVSRQSTSDSTGRSASSKTLQRVTQGEFAKSIAHLCALKRTASFTKEQVVAWYGGLSAFPVWVINRSILKLATSQERFPEFGDVYQLCRREAIQAGIIQEPYSPYGGAEKANVSEAEITSIGDALSLVVRR